MGKYDFDRIIERKGTGSLKYDPSLAPKGKKDLLPMWVADMDFSLPDEVLDEIKKRTDHGIFGYSEPDDEYYEVLQDWFDARYGWKPDREWVSVTPGVVFALSTAVRAFTGPGDAVIILEPVYYPFRQQKSLTEGSA